MVGGLDVVPDLSEDGLGGRRGAVLEVRVLLAGVGAELVDSGALGNGLQIVLAFAAVNTRGRGSKGQLTIP